MKVLIKQNIDIDDVKGGEFVNFIFDYNNSSVVYPLVDNISFFSNDPIKIKEESDRMEYYKYFHKHKEDIIFLDGIKISGIFEGYSRIDGMPIFIVDDPIGQERNHKLASILS